MEDLIKALQIFMKYKNEKYPTNCSHDLFVVCGIMKDSVSLEDLEELARLSFEWDEEYEQFYSFRFGSC